MVSMAGRVLRISAKVIMGLSKNLPKGDYKGGVATIQA
jgi:hypothetical protein